MVCSTLGNPLLSPYVEDDAAKSSARSGTEKSVNGTNAEDRIVNICVEKVFEKLKEKNER